MKFTLFGFEIEFKREDKSSTFNRWECKDCGETGWFLQHEGEDRLYWPSGTYDWRTYPEMRCECRRHHEEANREAL